MTTLTDTARPMDLAPPAGAPITVEELLAALDGLPAFLTVRQAADVIGLSRSAAYRAVERGDLPTVRLAGRLRVPIGALLKMMGLIQPTDGATTPWAQATVASAR